MTKNIRNKQWAGDSMAGMKYKIGIYQLLQYIFRQYN